MPRLRNAVNGVVINVSDEKAARMGDHWVPFEAEVVEDKPARKPRAKKSEV